MKHLLFFTLFLVCSLSLNSQTFGVQVEDVPIKGETWLFSDGSMRFDSINLPLNNIQNRKWLPYAWVVYDLSPVPVAKHAGHVSIEIGNYLTKAMQPPFQNMIDLNRTGFAYSVFFNRGWVNIDNLHSFTWIDGNPDGTTPQGLPSNSMEIFGMPLPVAGDSFNVGLLLYAVPE